MIHAMVWGLVPMSGAGTSFSGPIWSMISAVYRRVIRSSSPRERLAGSQMTPPLAPPKGMFTTAHFQVIHAESARTSSRVTFLSNRIPPLPGPARDVVEDPVADEDLDVAVVHDDRDRDLGLADRLPQHLVEARIEAELLRGDVEPRHHLVEGAGRVETLGLGRSCEPGKIGVGFDDLVHGAPRPAVRPPSLEWSADCIRAFPPPAPVNGESPGAISAKLQREADGLGPDPDLVQRILHGEELLFEALVRRYQARVVAHVARMVGSREDALDLTQEIFLKVFGALDRYNPEFKFSTWLFRIAGNAAIDHLRKRRPKTVPLEIADPESRSGVSAVEHESSGLDPYAELRNVERGKAISRAIADLPFEFRELITLRHFGGLSYEEIARLKNMPLGTVKNKLFRARVVLKERLAGEW